jgi:class 3 adenylate cyclase/tetratricopeptide (TPR) repeat protein
VRGAGLFADISGFTPLAELLTGELGARRGAEELTSHLDRVFGAAIEELHRWGGEVIYFSGDAITCWFDGDTGHRAVTCAFAMRLAFERASAFVSGAGAPANLALKVAVAVGRARRFVVGDPAIQLIEVLGGGLVDDLAAAESCARPGEIVVTQSAAAALGDAIVVADQRVQPERGENVAVVASVDNPAAETPAPAASLDLDEDLVRSWVLPEVYERLRADGGTFLAELRPVYPVFVRFAGIDLDENDEAAGVLDAFVRRSQQTFNDHGGNVLQLTLGDKGAYLYGVFGSPIAHSDDADRAAATALALMDVAEAGGVRDIQIGIAHGRVRSGTYGHPDRRTFSCIGDPVNLAARLMSTAHPGEIRVAAAVQRDAGQRFSFAPLPDVVVKGKTEPVQVAALLGRNQGNEERTRRFTLPMVGRGRELAAVAGWVAESRAGAGRVVAITGEPGHGKSRLVAEVVRDLRDAGHEVIFGEAQAYGIRSYDVWREVWRSLFGLRPNASGNPDDLGTERATVQRALGAISPRLARRSPLVASIVDVDIPDNGLTRRFDAKLRKTSLEALLVDVLTARARREPLVVVLEDAHAIDELSRDLLVELARASQALPVAFLLTASPERGLHLGVEQLATYRHVHLGDLAAGAIHDLVEAKARELFGETTAVSAAVHDLVASRAEGNPFAAEQVLSYFRDEGIDLADDRALQSVDLPDSIHSLVLGRIDRLRDAPRRTLKVASVVGAAFIAATVAGAYPQLGSARDVTRQLADLQRSALVLPERVGEDSWYFRHGLLQEVAYESLPFALRTELHGNVGRHLEGLGPAAVDRALDVLAHHYWLSDDQPKKREFLARAGAAAQAAYANAAAIDYFERLAPLLAPAERPEVLLKLAKVLELTGNWDQAQAVVTEAFELALEAGDREQTAWCEAALAETARKQGNFDDASEHLQSAARLFEELDDDGGRGQVLHLAGTVAAQRGDYDAADRYYNESLVLRERLGDEAAMAALFSNLGVVAEYRGDYARSLEHNERALALRTELGDPWGIGVSQTNIGMIHVLEGRYEEAKASFEEAMRLNLDVGDPWMVAITHNNLGNANRGLGDESAARSSYAASLRAYIERDDRWALAFLLEDIASLAAQVGAGEHALRLLGAADSLREEIGAPRSPALEEELSLRLAPVMEAVGAEGAAIRDGGRTLSITDAVRDALLFCESPSDEASTSAHGT